MKCNVLAIALMGYFLSISSVHAQTTERARPAEWKNLVFGGRFMDRFLPMPNKTNFTLDTWGASGVVPRFTDNGIEDKTYSYWGGNIKYDSGRYNLYVSGWLESSPKGHFTWPNSVVFHAISDSLSGPYKVIDTIGKGHNTEAFKLSDGRYVIYVIGGYYIGPGCNGPWTYGKFDFENRDRKIMDGLSNLTYAQREDGSYLMVNRGGGVWISQTGISPYNQISEESAYPKIKGNFEDPVVWRDNIQYNLIVNDWLGRIAYYLRSKDGMHWKVESGEAYMPGVSKHEDGAVEAWFKYERLRFFQDSYGRAIQGNFAVIDVEKNFDKASDNHSSKNIDIPVTAGRLITILDKKAPTKATEQVRIKVKAEKGFDPQKDIDLSSLRFGASEDVNYGRGMKVLKTTNAGPDLIVTFRMEYDSITDDGFAAKLLGKTKTGKLLFGYARLPWIDFLAPILSARLPEITATDNGFSLKVEVQNFGQTNSGSNSILKVVYVKDGQDIGIGTAKIPMLKPYEKTDVSLTAGKIFEAGVGYDIKVIINPNEKNPDILQGKITPLK